MNNKCIDCNKNISRRSKRCRYCNGKVRRKKPNRCINCGKKVSKSAKRCAICSMKELFRSLNNKKNKSETFLEFILKKNVPKEYKYVGNGRFFIEKYNPDFININGQKKIIELFGDYWHNKPGIKEKDARKMKVYKNYGYDCLVIWEKDLKKNNLEKRILDFNKLKSKTHYAPK